MNCWRIIDRYEALIAQLRMDPSIELMEQMFTLLTQHIRREEKELFEQVQRALPRETLDRMGAKSNAKS